MADKQVRGLDMPSGNPLAVIQDPRVVATAVGILAAHMSRKATYTSFRDAFGYALSKNGAPVKFYKDGAGTAELPDAARNRLLFSLGQVLLGTVVMGQSNEVTLDYLGLGFAGSGFANVVSLLVGLE